MKSPITTHVLDTSRGLPAVNLAVRLEMQSEKGDWQLLAENRTNQDGRCSDLLPASAPLATGLYRLTFATGNYFQALALPSFYPYVTIVFEIVASAQHYHVPLLLSPFGYSTYRGS